MADHATTADLDAWVRRFAALVSENKDYLTELDAAIGDADHGSNLDRGMTAAVAALDELGPTAAGPLFSKVGMTLVSTVGGASGPLFGTLFLRMGTSLGDTDAVDAGAARGGAAGRTRRRRGPRQGRSPATRRCTTRWRPPSTRSTRRVGEGADLADGARPAPATPPTAGRDATIPMLARKGRASYLGERSVGHQDPGATSVALLLGAADTVALTSTHGRSSHHDIGTGRRHRRRLAQPRAGAGRARPRRRDAARPPRATSRSPPASTSTPSAPTPSGSRRRSRRSTAPPASSS